MTIKTWLEKATNTLHDAGIATASLDATLLVSHVLGKDKAWIIAHEDESLSESQLKILESFIGRRKQHEPIAYIRGKQEFYGRDFSVSPNTLTPRPETETLVELALEILTTDEAVSRVADVGTGSGCIIITLACEMRDNRTYEGYEISDEAIEIAEHNATTMKASVTIIQDDITSDDTHKWRDADLIVANLPYVPDDFSINLAATHEPKFAIYGGKDGLDYYRYLFEKVKNTKYIITESLPPQHNDLKNIASLHGYKQLKSNDFIQLFTRIID